MSKLPMQPIYLDDEGVVRFQENKIVRWLVDNGNLNLNDIAKEFYDTGNNDDLEQFSQLIGYSISGYADLSYVSNKSYNIAERRTKKLLATPGSSEKGKDGKAR